MSKLRPVDVYETIYPQGPSQPSRKNKLYSGFFHGWGVHYDEYEAGPGNFTIAIVELHSGKVITPMPFNIVFTDYKDHSEEE